MTVRFTGTTFGNVFTTARYYVKTVAAGNITVSTTPVAQHLISQLMPQAQ
jgi:hypothetical protein